MADTNTTVTAVNGVEFDEHGEQFLLLSFPKGIKNKGSVTSSEDLPKYTQIGDAYTIGNKTYVKGLNKDGYAVWSCSPLTGLETRLEALL